MSNAITHIETEKRSAERSRSKFVPEIRFKEFDDYWEKYKMEQLADCYDGTHQTPTYVASGVPFVSVENVKSYATKSKFITKEAFDKNFKTKPKKGDVIMTRITAGIIGMTSIVENDDDLAYYVSVALIRKKKDIGSSFLAHRIESEGFKRELHKRIIHVAFPKKINLGDLQKCVTYTPTLPEQQKIASFLSAVDEKIQQLTKKKALLEQYKKGVMQQLFSGQLRFKDENGNAYPDWEEKRLREITKYTKGFAFKSADYQDSGVRIVRVSDLLSSSIKKDNEKVFIAKGKANNFDKYQLVEGNIIITTVGSKPEMLESAVGRGIYINNNNEGLLNQNMLKFENIEGVTNQFLIALINSRRYQHHMKGIARGNANQANITVVDLLQYKVALPSLPEQQKIATYLSSIDIKIESVNNQITQTQSFKKGLLQQMFVAA